MTFGQKLAGKFDILLGGMYKGRPSTFSILTPPPIPRVKQKSLSVPFLNRKINIFFRHKL